MVSYLPDTDEYKPSDQVPKGVTTWSISGTELRNRLKTGADIPTWFTYPEVLEVLRQVYPPRSKQGFTITIVGNYSAKSLTLANALESVFSQSGKRSTVLLVPTGEIKPFSKQETQQFALTASQVAKCGGATISVPITDDIQELESYEKVVSKFGGSITVHLSTHIEEAKKNARSTFYSENKFNFQDLKHATITADPTKVGISQILHEVILVLEEEGYIGSK